MWFCHPLCMWVSLGRTEWASTLAELQICAQVRSWRALAKSALPWASLFKPLPASSVSALDGTGWWIDGDESGAWLASVLLLPSLYLGARPPFRGRRARWCANCQELPQGELCQTEVKYRRLYYQTVAWPPRFRAAQRESGSQWPWLGRQLHLSTRARWREIQK